MITGGAGYIGSHIAERINTNKYNIIIYDNLVTGRKKLINKKAKFVKGDIKLIRVNIMYSFILIINLEAKGLVTRMTTWHNFNG